MKEVQVYASLSGDYAAWHEIGMPCIEYDITNGIQVGERTEEECKNWQGDYTDIDIVTAYLDDNGNYYLKLW